MDQWEVIVAVGAELDLPEPVRFGAVLLGNPPRHASVQLPPDPVLPDVPGQHVVSLQQVTRILTSTFYWVIVDADDDEGAQRLVERDVDPIVSVGLSLILNQDVTTQVLRVQKLGGSEQPPTAWGAGGRLIRLAQHRPDRVGLAHLLDALRGDEHLTGCLPYVARATKYLAITPTAGDLAVDAALLELAKALEYLVRKTPREADQEDATSAERILSGLRKTLSGGKGSRRKVSAVKEAARSLQRLERRTVSDSVRAFASRHGLGREWTASAVRLVEVRHKHLAHPGERMSNADRDALAGHEHGAREAVLEAVRVTLKSRTGVDIPSAPVARPIPEGDVTVRWQPGQVATWSPTAPVSASVPDEG